MLGVFSLYDVYHSVFDFYFISVIVGFTVCAINILLLDWYGHMVGVCQQ